MQLTLGLAIIFLAIDAHTSFYIVTTQNSQASGFPSLKEQNVRDSCETAQLTVLVSVTVDVMKYHTESKLGRKGFGLLTCPHCCPSPKEVRTGAQTGQEPGGRS